MILGFWRRPQFDPEILSSIWVMASRDDSPVLTAYSVAYRLRFITPAQVMDLVKGRRELFRTGLGRGQSRAWKERFRSIADDPHRTAEPAKEGDDDAPASKRVSLPEWLRVFDDEDDGDEAEKDRIREWLDDKDKSIKTAKDALARFLDRGFIIDDNAFRSQFRVDSRLESEPSDIATVNWGLEHIDRLRRGHTESRQSWIALFTGLSGVAIGAFVAVTAPMMTTLYQGRPVDVARVTIDHQTLLTNAGSLGVAIAGARRANATGDQAALRGALDSIDNAGAILQILLDGELRDDLRSQQMRLRDTCALSGPQAPGLGGLTCTDALADLQRLLDGPLADFAKQ